MSLSILPVRAALGVNTPQPFSGVGGTAPYSYSMVSGNGTVNPSTGLYTAPATVPPLGPTTPRNIVRVTDALGAKADAVVQVLTPLMLLCDVLATELDLPGRVWVWDQKIDEPTDQEMYIIVQALVPKPFSSSRFYRGVSSSLQEHIAVNMNVVTSIDIKSRGPAARDRITEVIAVLNSTYSEQQQGLNSFRIFPLTSNIINLNELDGAAIPYRYNLSVAIQYTETKIKSIPYYNTFADPEVETEA